jgi:hypothetical protein
MPRQTWFYYNQGVIRVGKLLWLTPREPQLFSERNGQRATLLRWRGYRLLWF